MATFTKGLLSATAADDGQAFPVVSSHDTVHTGPSLATSYDEIWIYASNASASDVTLTIGWGEEPSTNDDLEIVMNVTAKTGYHMLIPGLILKGNASTALVVTAYASATNAVNLTGYVNHILA